MPRVLGSTGSQKGKDSSCRYTTSSTDFSAPSSSSLVNTVQGEGDRSEGEGGGGGEGGEGGEAENM